MTYDPIPQHQWVWLARLVRIVDADTIDCELDAGFRAIRSERLRLLGLNAPEVVGADKARGRAATAFVEQWMADHCHPLTRWPLMVRTEKETDSFGRYLAVVYARDCDACLNADLLASGHAVEDARP